MTYNFRVLLQMSQPSAATSSFTVVCPGCGQRLRFSIGAETPPRVRIRCSACNHQFGVRRPGADPSQGDVTVAGATPPTLTGTPIPAIATAVAPTQPTAQRPPGEPAFAPGDKIAERYSVVRFLARGGMGEVYEVEDRELRERVALKTVRGDVSRDNLAIERFRREIQLARKVTHPNVCRIFDVAFHGGVIFLTMELLEGETLAQRLRRAGPMSTEEALPVARQIAEALHAAHQAGIVHRDLKPGNVVLSESRGTPRAVVTDFGLARLESGEDAMTLTAHAGVVGTPAYLAPEQVEGKEITGAVDVYALGIVLYEMLTGTVPFVGDTALSVAVRRLQERPASPRVHVPGLDARWEAAILRCLERDPAARFHSAPEAVQFLTAPLAPIAPIMPKIEEKPAPPVPAPAPIPVPALAPAPAKKNKLQIIALAALLLLAVGVGTFRYLGWRAEQDLTPEQRLARLTEGITPRRSVAVLGFQNLSRTPGTEWLSTGIAEMLASELGAGSGLRIVPGENVARAKVELGLSDENSL
ncbi:MAG TPA: protein kinase, partial [Thermoanaerobaculia bacterium]|nr:protein kinase [Thermoanaerobaculia bacterium]